MSRLSLRLLPVLVLLPGFAMAQTPEPAKGAVNFKDHVAPILRKHCVTCHNADKPKSDFDVTTYQAVMAGGASGEAVKPGVPGQSLLYRVTAHEVEPVMPPKGPKIPDADLAVIKKWIEGGAAETAIGAAKASTRKIDLDPATTAPGKLDGPPPMPTNLPSVTALKTDRAHPVTALAASPWAPVIAVAGHEQILLYNSETLERLGILPFPERIAHVLKFSRNGKWLLAAGGRGAASGKVVIFDVVTGKRVTEIGDEADIILAADVSPDHKLVALGGPGKLIKVYDTATGQLRHKIKKHTDWVTALEFSPDGDLLASGDRTGGAYLWEAATGGIVFTLGDHKDAITALSWRADSQMVASSSEDGRVILWYAEDGFPTRTFVAQADPKASAASRGKLPGVLSVEYAKNGLLLTCGRDNSARIWKADGNQAARLDGFTDLPSKVTFSHDGQRAFVGDFTGAIRVWSTKTGKQVGQISTNPQ